MGWTRGATGEEPRKQEWHGGLSSNRFARTGVMAWMDTDALRENTVLLHDAEVLWCSMLSSLKACVEACTWCSGTQDSAKWSAIRNGQKITITGPRRRKITVWTSFQKKAFVSFQNSCHNSFVDTSYLLLQMSEWHQLLFFYFSG